MRGAGGTLAILLVASILGGCLGGPEPEPLPTDPEPQPPAPPDPDWGTLTLSMTGAAGDWVLVHQPLPPNITDASHTISGSLALDGDGVALVVAPDLAFDVAGGLAFLHDGPYARTSGGTVDLARAAATGWHESMRGFVFGVGATVPWAINVTIMLATDGPESETAHVMTGNGTTGSVSPTTAGTGAPLGQASVSLVSESPGWTHLGLVVDTVQPSGVHQVDAAFASGHSFTRQGAAARLAAPAPNGGVASGYFTDIGTVANQAGDNTLSAVFADLATGAAAVAVHLPGADQWAPVDVAGTTYAVGR